MIAGAVFLFRNRLPNERHEKSSPLAGFSLLSRKRFGFGALCIFLYVGAEVSIGSLIVNYLQQQPCPRPDRAGRRKPDLPVLGRGDDRPLHRQLFPAHDEPGLILASVAAGAIALLAISTHSTGAVSAYSLLAIGLMNSIMFPTIFSLACEKLGARAADGSGIINIAIFGGAVIPLLTGMLADASGSLRIALILPALCYAIIAAYGFYARRPASDVA